MQDTSTCMGCLSMTTVRVLAERAQGLQAVGRGAVAATGTSRVRTVTRSLRSELVKLARQKPRYGYRRLHALLERRGDRVYLPAVSGGGLERAQEERKRFVQD